MSLFPAFALHNVTGRPRLSCPRVIFITTPDYPKLVKDRNGRDYLIHRGVDWSIWKAAQRRDERRAAGRHVWP